MKIAAIIVSLVFLTSNCFAVTTKQCELLEALSKLDRSTYDTKYQGKRITINDRDIISSLLSEYYDSNTLSNRAILSETLSNDAIQCSQEGYAQKSVTSSIQKMDAFDNLSMYVAGYVANEVKNERYKNMQKNKSQSEDRLYKYVAYCSQRLFSSGLANDEINQLSALMDENSLVSDKVLRAADAIIKIMGLIKVHEQIETKISEVEIYNIQYNDDNYIRNNESVLSSYKGNYMTSCMDIQIDSKLFPDLYSNFEVFKTKFEQALERYSTAIKHKEVALRQAKEEEQQRLNSIAQQKVQQEKEARQQRIKEKCTQYISSFALSDDEYNYIIPGGGTFTNGMVLGEFLCISKGAGTLTKFSKPGLFSDSYDLKYESDGKVTYLELVKVVGDDNIKYSVDISRKNGTFLRLSKISSANESKNLKSMIEHSTVMDQLIYGLVIQAQIHSPELFQ